MNILKAMMPVVAVSAAAGAQAFVFASNFEETMAGGWDGTGGVGGAFRSVHQGTPDATTFLNTFGWTVTGNQGTGVDLVRDIWSNTPNSQPGHQWVDLAGSPGPGGITREVQLYAGVDYRIFWDAFRNNTDYSISVSLAGLHSFTWTTQLTNTWTSFNSPTFTPTTSGVFLLSFSTPQGGSGNVGVDNIMVSVVDAHGQPVPEPATLALGAAGLLAALRRRRARRG